MEPLPGRLPADRHAKLGVWRRLKVGVLVSILVVVK